MAGPRESNLAGLHRLSKDFEAVTAKFWQLVQKQYATMSKGNFSGAWLAAATDQSRSAGAVVGIAKWPLKDGVSLRRRAGNIA